VTRLAGFMAPSQSTSATSGRYYPCCAAARFERAQPRTRPSSCGWAIVGGYAVLSGTTIAFGTGCMHRRSLQARPSIPPRRESAGHRAPTAKRSPRPQPCQSIRGPNPGRSKAVQGATRATRRHAGCRTWPCRSPPTPAKARWRPWGRGRRTPKSPSSAAGRADVAGCRGCRGRQPAGNRSGRRRRRRQQPPAQVAERVDRQR
jgi:hypothetical protein